MRSLPVWILGLMFLLRRSFCAWFHVSSGSLCKVGLYLEGRGLVSIWGIPVPGVSMTDPHISKGDHCRRRYAFLLSIITSNDSNRVNCHFWVGIFILNAKTNV